MNEPIENIGVSPVANEDNHQIALSKWTQSMLHNQAILLELAQQNQLAKDRTHMSKFDANRLTVYPDNAYVLVAHFDGAMGKRGPSKFHPILKGPYRVMNHKDHDEYTLQNLVTEKLKKIHEVKQKKELEFLGWSGCIGSLLVYK